MSTDKSTKLTVSLDALAYDDYCAKTVKRKLKPKEYKLFIKLYFLNICNNLVTTGLPFYVLANLGILAVELRKMRLMEIGDKHTDIFLAAKKANNNCYPVLTWRIDPRVGLPNRSKWVFKTARDFKRSSSTSKKTQHKTTIHDYYMDNYDNHPYKMF